MTTSSEHLSAHLRPAPAQAPVKLSVFLIGWVLFLFLNPIYVNASGEPQPSDFLTVLFLVFMVTGYGFRIPVHRDLYLVGYLFLMWVATVNTLWWLQLGERQLILSSLYFVFNFGIVVFILGLAHTHGPAFATVTRLALMATLVGELAYVLVTGTDGWRAIGTFNYPNQLGYWNLLSVASLLVLKGERRLTNADLLVLGAAVMTTFLSGSRGALLGLFALIGVALVWRGLDSRWGSILGLLALGLVATLVVAGFSLEPGAFDRLVEEIVPPGSLDRLNPSANHRNVDIASRGYDRLWLYPEHLVLGAGEGAYARFDLSALPRAHLEMHSAFGTILFSYGMPGLAIFGLLFWRVFRRAQFSHFLYFLPVCFYNLTHQGIRFSMFWVFVALVIAVSRHGHHLLPPAPARAAPPPGRPATIPAGP